MFLNRSILIAAMTIMIVLEGCDLTPPSPATNNQTTVTTSEAPNLPPVADAGEDRSILITDASAVLIDGSGSMDPDDDPLEYTWHVLGEGVTLSDIQSHSCSFTINLPSSGVYYFVLFVDDGTAKSAPSILTITVLPPDGWVDDDYPEDDLESSQFTTVQRAIDTLGNDTCIVLMPGIYEENVTVDAGVHLFGAVSQSGDMPEISAPVADTDGTRAVVTLNDDSTLENIVVSCSTSPTTDSLLSIVNVESITSGAVIRNCRIKTAYGYQNHYVDGVTIDSGATLSIGGGSVIENISGEGIVAWQTSNLMIENTRIGHASGSSIYTIQSEQFTLNNCVIHHSGSDGLDLTSTSVEIDHCTVAYFNRAGIKVSGTSEWSLKNTLVYSGGAAATIYSGDISIETIDRSNLPNRFSGSDIDPMFLDADNGDFRLHSDSPAIGNGENGSNVGATGDVLSP